MAGTRCTLRMRPAAARSPGLAACPGLPGHAAKVPFCTVTDSGPAGPACQRVVLVRPGGRGLRGFPSARELHRPSSIPIEPDYPPTADLPTYRVAPKGLEC